jgi:hypothetical protein
MRKEIEWAVYTFLAAAALYLLIVYGLALYILLSGAYT